MSLLTENALARALYPSTYFEIKQDHAGKWRWHLKSENGNILADSGQGYARKEDCEHGIKLVKQSGNAPVR